MARINGILALAVSVALPCMATADVINVAAGQSIQAAINIAADGDEIIVAPGTYFQIIDLKGKAVHLRSSDGPATTIIDGTNLFDPVIKCVTGEEADTIIEGFTITGGEATDAAPNNRGGGLYCNLSEPTITNCVFEFNEANIGGAFYLNEGSSVFTDCIFRNNDASGSGGAGYINNAIPTFNNCVFEDNTSGSNGGALRTVSSGGEYHDCTFSGNMAASNGGAIDSASSSRMESFFDCVFTGNTAGGKGGGFQVGINASDGPQLFNVIFEHNTSTSNGGGMNLEAGAESTVYNCTFYGNTSMNPGGGGAIYESATASADVRNTIAWANLPNGFNAGVSAFNCNTQEAHGGSNISADPMFVDAPSGDYRLMDGSPSIDAGSALLIPTTLELDFDGLPRVINAGASPTGVPAYGYYVDQGAFEFQGEGVVTCPGDLNGDNMIDGSDLAGLLAGWGACN